MGEKTRWEKSIKSRIDFHLRGTSRARRDDDFQWNWYTRFPTAKFVDLRRFLKRHLRPIGGAWRRGPSREWFSENLDALWETRSLLADALSCSQFDDAILLRIAGYRRFYFGPEEFSDLFVVSQDVPFAAPGLPSTFLGSPLRDLALTSATTGQALRLIASEGMVQNHNRYRQYFARRGAVDFSPGHGDVVLDCGACVGDVGMLFASLIGDQGHVHMFDPIPVHIELCRLQVARNPALASRVTIVPQAVGERSNGVRLDTSDQTSREIKPNASASDDMPFTSIDDYVQRTGCRVTHIKMDIEGGEGGALAGAGETISSRRPILAISAYHRDDDLWTLRRQISAICPAYRFHFGHHTPVQWESVLYAVVPRG